MSRKTTAAARRTLCSTASVPMRTGVAGIPSPPERCLLRLRGAGAGACGPGTDDRRGQTSPTSAPRSAADSSRNRDTPARSVFMRSFPQAGRRRGGARSHSAGSAGRVPSCATAAPQVVHWASSRRPRTGQEAGPPRSVVEAHQGPRRSTAWGRRARHGPGARTLRRTGRCGVGVAAIDPFHGRPTGPLGRDGEPLSALPALTTVGGHGRGDDAGTASPAGPFGDDVHRAVRSAHSPPDRTRRGHRGTRAAETWKRGPGREPGFPTTIGQPAAAGRPVRGGRVAPPHQAPPEALGPPTQGTRTRTPPGRATVFGHVDHRQHEVEQIGRRRNPQHGGCPPPPPPGAATMSAEDGRRGLVGLLTTDSPRTPAALPDPPPRPATDVRTRRRRHARGRTGSDRPNARPPTRPDPRPPAAGPDRTNATAGGARRPRAGSTSSSTTHRRRGGRAGRPAPGCRRRRRRSSSRERRSRRA